MNESEDKLAENIQSDMGLGPMETMKWPNTSLKGSEDNWIHIVCVDLYRMLVKPALSREGRTMGSRLAKATKKTVSKTELEHTLGKFPSDNRWQDKGNFKEDIYKPQNNYQKKLYTNHKA